MGHVRPRLAGGPGREDLLHRAAGGRDQPCVLARFARPDSREENLKLLWAPKTQSGQGLQELAIGWIGERSPEAKGRVERHFQTAQDRLVKGMRLAGVDTSETANRYLERKSLALRNERFTVEPANATDAQRPLRAEHDLAATLDEVQPRRHGRGAVPGPLSEHCPVRTAGQGGFRYAGQNGGAAETRRTLPRLERELRPA